MDEWMDGGREAQARVKPKPWLDRTGPNDHGCSVEIGYVMEMHISAPSTLT